MQTRDRKDSTTVERRDIEWSSPSTVCIAGLDFLLDPNQRIWLWLNVSQGEAVQVQERGVKKMGMISNSQCMVTVQAKTSKSRVLTVEERACTHFLEQMETLMVIRTAD